MEPPNVVEELLESKGTSKSEKRLLNAILQRVKIWYVTLSDLDVQMFFLVKFVQIVLLFTIGSDK